MQYNALWSQHDLETQAQLEHQADKLLAGLHCRGRTAGQGIYRDSDLVRLARREIQAAAQQYDETEPVGLFDGLTNAEWLCTMLLAGQGWGSALPPETEITPAMIADRLGISQSVVSRRLRQARDRLQRRMKQVRRRRKAWRAKQKNAPGPPRPGV